VEREGTADSASYVVSPIGSDEAEDTEGAVTGAEGVLRALMVEGGGMEVALRACSCGAFINVCVWARVRVHESVYVCMHVCVCT
jgi:hypothetical protein